MNQSFSGLSGARRLLLLLAAFSMLLLPGELFALDEATEHVLEIGRAIDGADADSFSQLVDVDAILENALDTFVQEATRPENATRLPPMLAMILPQLTSGKGKAPVRDLLLGEARNFVMDGIASGAFAGRKPDPARSSGLLAPLFASASMGRKEITDIGTPRKIENGWLVPFSIHDHDNGYDYPVKGRLEYRNDALILTGVDNMRQLIYQIGEESAASQ